MKNSIRSIHEGGLGKRLIAMIMDAVVFAFVAVALALWVCTPIANKAMHYEESQVKCLKWRVFSDLYVIKATNSEEETTVVEFKDLNSVDGESELEYIPLNQYDSDDLDFYKNRLQYYYCSFKTGENLQADPEKPIEDYRAGDYNILIKDNNGNEVAKKDFYNNEWFSSLIKDAKTKKDYQDLAVDALTDLIDSSYYTEADNQIRKCQIFIIVPPFVISFLGFYILVPLLFKNGETFGKKVMKIGFVTKDGFEVKKRHIVFRQILVFFWVTLSAMFGFIYLSSFATLGVGIVIYLIATVISKTKRSPIDYAAYIYLIDTSKSVWFKDAEEEAKKEEELEEKMSKYRHYEPDNSKVIQIGSEIVNEDVKKELEEEKLKKNKK